MATKLHGRLNLSKIPKELIQKGRDGSSYVWVDVAERRTPGQYGDTHNISIYDKANKSNVFIGDLRPQEFGESSPAPAKTEGYRQKTQSAPVSDEGDLPF